MLLRTRDGWLPVNAICVFSQTISITILKQDSFKSYPTSESDLALSHFFGMYSSVSDSAQHMKR